MLYCINKSLYLAQYHVCLLTILEQTPVSDNIAIASSVFLRDVSSLSDQHCGSWNPLVPAVHVAASGQHHLRAFSYAGPSAWNGLSEDLRAVADPAEFRKHLKTHFFTEAHNVY